MFDQNDVTQEEIDAAIVQCLRIFAARGRQLRLQRERDRVTREQAEKENGNPKPIHAEPDNLSAISSAPEIEHEGTLPTEGGTTASDTASEEPECPS